MPFSPFPLLIRPILLKVLGCTPVISELWEVYYSCSAGLFNYHARLFDQRIQGIVCNSAGRVEELVLGQTGCGAPILYGKCFIAGILRWKLLFSVLKMGLAPEDILNGNY